MASLDTPQAHALIPGAYEQNTLTHRQRRTVLAAGLGQANDEGTRLPMDVKASDTVLFGKDSGQDDVLAIQERSL